MCWDVFPGNTADPVDLRSIVSKLRKRFYIGRVIVVDDRGMMSENTMSVVELLGDIS